MININSSTTINRPVSEVFQFITNHENAQLWLGGWLETRPTSEVQGVGYTWVDVIEMLGRRVETEYKLTEVELDQKLAFNSIGGSFPVSGLYSFAPAGEGTTLTFEIEGQSSGFFKIADPLLNRLLQRQWDTNLANIKDILEAGGAVGA